MTSTGTTTSRLAICLSCLLLTATGSAFAQDDDRVSQLLFDAEAALQNNQYQEASRAYRDAARISDDPAIARQATLIGYSYRFDEDALASARRWLKLTEQNDVADDEQEALLYVAQLYLRTGSIRRSQRYFERLLELGDQPPDDRLLALIPFLSQEDEESAYDLMSRLAKPYKDSAEANYAVAVMALQAGEAEVAGERAKTSFELEPDWIKPHLLYARALLMQGDQEGAIDYTARLIGDDPRPDPEARLELAIMLLSAGRDDDALSQVNQILLEQPNRTDALRLMAIINFRLDHLDAARADFQDLLESGYFTMDALYYLGHIADRDQENEQAIRYYVQVTRGSNAVMSQRRAAGIMAQIGKEDEALEHLSRFAEIHPKFAIDMLQAKAQLLASLERYPEALDHYDKVVAYRPDSEGVHLGKAELLLRMGRLDDAIALYRQSVKRWPDSAMSLNALGYTLADRTDQYDEAEKLIGKALALDPESAAIIDSWGWVLYRQGQNDEALKHLERAYERFKDPEVAAHVVEVLWALERQDEARSRLADAELLFPDNDFLNNVRERLFGSDP